MSVPVTAVGRVLPQRGYHVDQALIDLYAEISGDRNPLHTDPDFAATTHFGRTIAHGMMTLAFISEAIESWAGPGWAEGGAIDVTFLSPVYPGEDVVISGTIGEGDGTDVVSCSIGCVASGRTILAGTARWRTSGPAAEA